MENVNDDVLFYICSFITLADILSLEITCNNIKLRMRSHLWDNIVLYKSIATYHKSQTLKYLPFVKINKRYPDFKKLEKYHTFKIVPINEEIDEILTNCDNVLIITNDSKNTRKRYKQAHYVMKHAIRNSYECIHCIYKPYGFYMKYYCDCYSHTDADGNSVYGHKYKHFAIDIQNYKCTECGKILMPYSLQNNCILIGKNIWLSFGINIIHNKKFIKNRDLIRRGQGVSTVKYLNKLQTTLKVIKFRDMDMNNFIVNKKSIDVYNFSLILPSLYL